MKRILSAAVTLCFFVAAAAASAQTDTRMHQQTTTKESGPAGKSRLQTEEVTGIVKEYEPGKKIKISGPGDKSYSFDLDNNARVEGPIVVGEMARVEFSRSSDGRKSVRVLSRASREDVSVTTAPTSYMETTTKEKGPEGSRKMKTETLVGTVKEYEAGKKIKVTGPDNKSYSFNLDEAVSMTGPIAIGDRVKVTYTKGDSDEKVTVLAPYKGKA
jgi:hypothetical protein